MAVVQFQHGGLAPDKIPFAVCSNPCSCLQPLTTTPLGSDGFAHHCYSCKWNRPACGHFCMTSLVSRSEVCLCRSLPLHYLFVPEWYPDVWTSHRLLAHSSVDAGLGFWHLGAGATVLP